MCVVCEVCVCRSQVLESKSPQALDWFYLDDHTPLVTVCTCFSIHLINIILLNFADFLHTSINPRKLTLFGKPFVVALLLLCCCSCSSCSSNARLYSFIF